MNKTFKKIAASIMAVTSLAVSMVGMSANALTASDNYSIFNWNRNGSNVEVSITNTSGANRYAQVNAYGYSSTGVYVGHIGGDARIADNATLRKSGTLTGAYSVTYGGTLYTSTSPVGTPLSSWQRSIGG